MPDFDFTSILEKNLKTHLEDYLPDHALSEAYLYAVLPAGKLFRPKLAACIENYYQANNSSKTNLENTHHPLAYFCSAIEIHHAYTLVHDDLPVMDNDDMRRGKLSTHKKYGQWQAILVGDGLLNISYGLLAKMNHPHAGLIIRMSAKMLGPSGLIHGQVLDLSHEMNTSFEKCRQTHFAKTARLIQFSLLGPALLQHQKKMPLNEWKKWLRIGQSLGLLFQFLDDLTELADDKLSPHEREINPWIKYWSQSLQETQSHFDLIKKYRDIFILLELSYYFDSILKTVNGNLENIGRHLQKQQKDLSPVMSGLDILSKMQN